MRTIGSLIVRYAINGNVNDRKESNYIANRDLIDKEQLNASTHTSGDPQGLHYPLHMRYLTVRLYALVG